MIPSDAILHTAEILALRHSAPRVYRQVTRLYTAYLRGIDRMPKNRRVNKQYLVGELDRNRVAALTINCDRYLRLVGFTTGGVITYPDAVLLCTDVMLTAEKRQSDASLSLVRQQLMREACLRYATDHHLLFDLSWRPRTRQRVVWRSPCGTTLETYKVRGNRLLRQ